MILCTVVARNYLPFARALGESIQNYHQDADFRVVVLDGKGEPADLQVVSPEEFIPQAEFRRMAAAYSITELATSVKPALLRRLLKEDDVVMYLDPDIALYRDLTELEVLVRRHDIVVTPHATEPIPRDGKRPTEQDLLISGGMNLGFIGVGAGSTAFLEWWAERLLWDCIIDPCSGLFVDQKWIDLALSFFDVFVHKDVGVNVAYWNLHHRLLEERDGCFTVNGHPLTFFHFSGFEPRARLALSRHQRGVPRITLSSQPALGTLCAEYRNQLLRLGYERAQLVPYGFGHSVGGIELAPLRRRYLDACRGGQVPPDPFDPTASAEFEAWAIAGSNGLASRVSKLGRFVAPKLPGVVKTRTKSVLQKTLQSLAAAGEDTALGMNVGRDVLATAGLPAGVNLVGYLKAEDGVGEVARGLAEALSVVGEQVASTSVRETPSRQRHPYTDVGSGVDFDISVVCVNADQIERLALSTQLSPPRYVVGYWAWEVAPFPERFAMNEHVVDEIWVYSQHAYRSVAPAVTCPVIVVPPVVNVAPVDLGTGRNGSFTVMTGFDFRSVFNRKNPLAVVQAFRRAFPKPLPDVSLIVKTVNAAADPVRARSLEEACASHPDVQVIDGYLSRRDQLRLLAKSSVFVSLHRAEGFGLHLAEAMALGVPVVATDYSGNTEFMNDDNSFLVPYRLVRIGEGSDPYPSDGQWAEPDIAVAAQHIRRLYDDPASSVSKVACARADIADQLSAAAVGRTIGKRLETIRARASRR